MVGGGSANAAATAGGLRFNCVTLKWQAVLIFGGQAILVMGGVIAMLLLQQDYNRAVARVESAQSAQVADADYLAGMTVAEAGLHEYLVTGDMASLVSFREGLAMVATSGSVLSNIETDATGQAQRDQMFAKAYAWQAYSSKALTSPPDVRVPQSVGDDIFTSYVLAHQRSLAHLDTVAATAVASETLAANRGMMALAVIGVIALVSVVAGAVLIQASTVRPMGRLIRAARGLAAGARTQLPPSSTPGEVGDLSRALHAWQRFTEKRTAVLEAMHAVSGRVDRDEIVRMSLERLLQVVDAAEVAVILIDDGGMVITTMTADAGLQEPRSLPPGSHVEALFGSSENVTGSLTDERWSEETRRWAKRQGYGPLTVVPMVSGSKIVGSVAATRRTGRPAFDPVEVSLVEAIAGPLAAAIRVAGLFDEVRAVSAQLDLVNRHKTDFLSSMSHELRTPLNSILGFADLLVTPGFDAVTAKQARYIANIHASGIHLASLINDALDLAKVESGKDELELAPVDVGKLVGEVITAMQPLAIAAQVKLQTSGGRPGTIAADQRKLNQVLLNLLSNAIKFTPPKGSVTIAMGRTDNDLLLTVLDTGIGVAANDQERIFGAFQQVQGANRDGGGTGLGLALSRQYVELHGGRLWLESELGQGSSFHVSLPITGGVGASANVAAA
jgi:signal transduction histidine kinase